MSKLEAHSYLLPHECSSVLEGPEGFVYLFLSAADQNKDLCVTQVGCKHDLRHRHQGKPWIIQFKPDNFRDDLAQSFGKSFGAPHNSLQFRRRDLLDRKCLDLVIDLDVVEINEADTALITLFDLVSVILKAFER